MKMKVTVGRKDFQEMFRVSQGGGRERGVGGNVIGCLPLPQHGGDNGRGLQQY